MFMINSLDSCIWLRYGYTKCIPLLFRDEFYIFLVMPFCIFKEQYGRFRKVFNKTSKNNFFIFFTFVPCILILSKLFFLFIHQLF